MTQRPDVRLIFLTSERNNPSVERDLMYVGHINVHGDGKMKGKATPTMNTDNLPTPSNTPSDFQREVQIKLSEKITKRNGTLYLAVFSTPIVEHITGKINILQHDFDHFLDNSVS